MAALTVGRGWGASVADAETVVSLTDDWLLPDAIGGPEGAGPPLDDPRLRVMRFDASRLGRWDSSLLVFLAALRSASLARNIQFDDAGLPAPARKLLDLIPATATPAGLPHPAAPLLERVGLATLARWSTLVAATDLLGALLLRAVPALRGRSRMRRSDWLDSAFDAGIAALPVITLVNLLVGGILAFVGAVQLRRYGADIYIANLVGVSMVREMAALMTAIVMCGRTGGAYAAKIATMNGSEEIDALRAIGIPLNDYLILPRASALTLMMPLLYLYGSAIGILGGLAVAMVTLSVSAQTYFDQMRAAVSGGEVLFGFAKSIVFGAFIAIASCRIGLASGRTAADVGRAATAAVVVGIVGVIALDSLFAVCANAVDF